MVSHPDTSPTLQDAITALPAVEGHPSHGLRLFQAPPAAFQQFPGPAVSAVRARYPAVYPYPPPYPTLRASIHGHIRHLLSSVYRRPYPPLRVPIGGNTGHWVYPACLLPAASLKALPSCCLILLLSSLASILIPLKADPLLGCLPTLPAYLCRPFPLAR